MSSGTRRWSGKHDADKQADLETPLLAVHTARTVRTLQRKSAQARVVQVGRYITQTALEKGPSHHLLFTYSNKSHNILWPFVL